MKLLSILSVLCLGSAAFAAEKTETIKVHGWKCDKCPPKTAAKVKAVDGVQSASADRAKGVLVVQYDDSKTKRSDVEKAIADSGFSVEK